MAKLRVEMIESDFIGADYEDWQEQLCQSLGIPAEYLKPTGGGSEMAARASLESRLGGPLGELAKKEVESARKDLDRSRS